MARRAPKMTRYEAEQLLGLSGSYDYKQYQRAVRAAIKANHPDMGGDADVMVRVVAAKEAIAYYFGDDKSQVMTAATDAAASSKEQKNAEYKEAGYTQEQARQEEAARQWAQDVHDAVNADKDKPFTDSEYTRKPQKDWTQQDWEAFLDFMPPRSYDNETYKKARVSTPFDPYTTYEADPFNLSVEQLSDVIGGWDDADWYYYWLNNARHPREDGKVWVRRKPAHFAGPYAEKERAERHSAYGVKGKYAEISFTGNCFHTPYGNVHARKNPHLDDDKFNTPEGWYGNVGVPFAYANSGNYEQWRQVNLQAQRQAIKEHGLNVSPIAEIDGWTGLEALHTQDRNADWIADMGLYVPQNEYNDLFGSYTMPDAIGVWEIHPKEPWKNRQAKHDLNDHAAANSKKKQAEGMHPAARFIHDHAKAASWLFIFVLYLLSMAFTPAMMGYTDSGFEEALRSMEPGVVIGAFLCEYTLPVAAFIFRKKIADIIRQVCEKTGKQ